MEGWVIFLIAIIGITALATVLSLMYRGSKKRTEGGGTAGIALSTTNIALIALLAVVLIVIAALIFFYSSGV